MGQNGGALAAQEKPSQAAMTSLWHMAMERTSR